MNSLKSRASILVCVVIPVIRLAAQGCCWSDVIPNGSTFSDAPSSSLAPFSFGGSRYQQVYRADNFVGPSIVGGVWLSNIAFRVDATNGSPIVGTYSGIQLNLSTTLRPPDGLSSIFAENVGLDDTAVLGPTNVSVIAGSSFDLIFSLSRPFFYVPANGNLLLDIRMGSSIFPSRLDAWENNLDAVSSVFSSSGASSGNPSTLGLVTYFDGRLMAVPEPSAGTLLLCALSIFLFTSRKRKR